MLKEVAQIAGDVLWSTLERVKGAVDAVAVRSRSAPNVVAQVFSGVEALGIIAESCYGSEEGVKVR